MKVVLLQDIKGLGRKFDIKEVKEGYGRNYLIARGLAKPAEKPTVQQAVSKKESIENELKKFEETLKSIQESIAKEKLVIEIKTGKNGEIFKSVTEEDIKKALKKRGFNNINIEPQKIHLKELGEHEVDINLSRGVKGKIKIDIEPEK